MIKSLIRLFSEEMGREDSIRMKRVAHHYAERARMDGEVIQKTGEIIPKESV